MLQFVMDSSERIYPEVKQPLQKRDNYNLYLEPLGKGLYEKQERDQFLHTKEVYNLTNISSNEIYLDPNSNRIKFHNKDNPRNFDSDKLVQGLLGSYNDKYSDKNGGGFISFDYIHYDSGGNPANKSIFVMNKKAAEGLLLKLNEATKAKYGTTDEDFESLLRFGQDMFFQQGRAIRNLRHSFKSHIELQGWTPRELPKTPKKQERIQGSFVRTADGKKGIEMSREGEFVSFEQITDGFKKNSLNRVEIETDGGLFYTISWKNNLLRLSSDHSSQVFYYDSKKLKELKLSIEKNLPLKNENEEIFEGLIKHILYVEETNVPSHQKIVDDINNNKNIEFNPGESRLEKKRYRKVS